MKVPCIDAVARPKTKTRATISSDAFYLIALALLLKKEKGNSSLLNYLIPGSKPVQKNKTAA